jgi:hypothetical protein
MFLCNISKRINLMKSLEALRHFDQYEMEKYLREDSARASEAKSSKGTKHGGLTTMVVILGLLAGSLGLLNYFSSQSSSNQTVYRNNDLN